MSDVVIAAGIAGAVALLIALGGGARYIVSLILDAYKRQAEATVDAKDAELTTLRADNTRLKGQVISELSAIRGELGELRQDLWSLRRGEPR